MSTVCLMAKHMCAREQPGRAERAERRGSFKNQSSKNKINRHMHACVVQRIGGDAMSRSGHEEGS
jgi:hypothetical protein